MCRTVEDVARVLEIIAGNDNNDLLTIHSQNKIPNNYTQFLQADGLKGSRIGILREISETEPVPEIRVLFEKAINDMRLMGAEIIDSVKIPNYSKLSGNPWCTNFKSSIKMYLTKYIDEDSLQTIDDIIRIGTKSTFTDNFLKTTSAKEEVECLDPYSDKNRNEFRQTVEELMDSLALDAFIYPTWNIKPFKQDSISEDYSGSNTAAISPQTGQPAVSLPMGFIKDNLPVGIEFLGRMYSEPTLFKLAYSYEQGTKHRRPPVLEKAITKDKLH